MWAILGDLVFDALDSPEAFDTARKAVYARHAVIGGKPALQFTGADADTVNMDFRFHFATGDPEARLTELRDLMDSHAAHTLVRGDGRRIGRFVVSEISETWRSTAADGTPLAIQGRVSLVEWTETATLEFKTGNAAAYADRVNAAAVRTSKTTSPVGDADSVAPATIVRQG